MKRRTVFILPLLLLLMLFICCCTIADHKQATISADTKESKFLQMMPFENVNEDVALISPLDDRYPIINANKTNIPMNRPLLLAVENRSQFTLRSNLLDDLLFLYYENGNWQYIENIVQYAPGSENIEIPIENFKNDIVILVTVAPKIPDVSRQFPVRVVLLCEEVLASGEKEIIMAYIDVTFEP